MHIRPNTDSLRRAPGRHAASPADVTFSIPSLMIPFKRRYSFQRAQNYALFYILREDQRIFSRSLLSRHVIVCWPFRCHVSTPQTPLASFAIPLNMPPVATGLPHQHPRQPPRQNPAPRL